MGTWELTDPPPNRVPTTNKWVFIKKFSKDSKLQKYKVRLVARGFTQRLGMDYNETFSPVIHLETICTILVQAVKKDWKIQQMDVKGAYLNGILKEEIYMKQPKGYDDETGRLCQLIKTLYGLKQSGCKWNKELNGQLESKGFTSLHSDLCVYIWCTNRNIEIITVWVNDLLLFSNTPDIMDHLQGELQTLFELTNMGDLTKIVRIEIKHNCAQKSLRITQNKYIESILEKWGMKDANSIKVPMDPKLQLERSDSTELGYSTAYALLIGSLMYTAITTCPDIAYAVSWLPSFTANPNMSHWTAAKQVLRYLAGTQDMGVRYTINKSVPKPSTACYAYVCYMVCIIRSLAAHTQV